ncbi:glycoside hydrolase family 97 catalytic domain-containing protein [Micromonospora sp. NPDC005707]|uniref:glycoside hydrolase family 97 protein n=1 Tax=Micromonospora sp. NPDC005707 TaxID=3157050 RepID=UPI00340C0872
MKHTPNRSARRATAARPTPRIAALALTLIATLLAGTLPATPARAGTARWTVAAASAPGAPRAEVIHDKAAGTISLAVSRGGRTVLAPSTLGIRTEGADLTGGLRFLGRSDRTDVERYTTTVGKQVRRLAIFREARFRFAGAGGARVDLVVRAARDGVAYRYELAGDHGSVLGEASAFTVPPESTAWLANHRRDYENPYVQTTAAAADDREYLAPALFDVDGTYLMIAESNLDGRYSGGSLVHDGTGTYRVKLWDQNVLVDGPLATPWRVMVVGDLDTIATSTLVDDLAPPSRISDTSWIHPGQVLWTWLAGGRAAGQSLTKQMGYVDYAAQRGWPYVAVDAGWYFDPQQWDVTDPNWRTTSWMPELVRYARERNVGIVVWIHYRDLDTPQERSEWLPTLHEWGVKGVKIDFMDSESQERLRWYDEILPATAANQLLVNFHGSNVPKGIHRVWPHVMTMEGVHGAEKSSLTTSHITALPFTRNVVGSMDYTPMGFHRNRPTSDAHELGLSVVFESGLQDLAGTPESYEARPEAVRFLEQVPTVWDETRLLAGRPADSAVFARRSGERWFLGGSSAGAARTLDVPLNLPAGRWLVELITDGDSGLVRSQRVMQAGDTLPVDVVADGGFAGLACRWQPKITTCDRP